MKVYVINLDRHPDRLAHMRRQLGDVDFVRVVAVDGTQSPETTTGLTRFELSCLESHRRAWRLFLSGPDAHACFLEDDVHLRPDFASLVHEEAWIPIDAHSVKFDTYLQRVKLGERRTAYGDRQVAPLYTRHESSAAYVLSRAGAERYLELTQRPTLPADYSLFPKKPRRFGLRIYQLAPAVAIQDHLLTSRGRRSNLRHRNVWRRAGTRAPASDRQALAGGRAIGEPGRRGQRSDLSPGSCETGDDDGRGRLGSRSAAESPYPPMLKLAIDAMLTISESFAPSETICTGFSNPTIRGPITVAPPSSCSIRVDMAAEWKAGMTRTFAVSFNATERIGRHQLPVECDIGAHLAIVFEIDSLRVRECAPPLAPVECARQAGARNWRRPALPLAARSLGAARPQRPQLRCWPDPQPSAFR